MPEVNKIPRIIHYCWFGKGEKSNLIKKCMLSWKKYAPDFEIKERNESNCNLKANKWVSDAYKNKRRAFVADYFRLVALYQEGGVYLDTDTELVAPLDGFINRGYGEMLGFIYRSLLSAGVIATVKNNKDIENLIKIYDSKKYEEITINDIMKDYYLGLGLVMNGRTQILKKNNIIFYSSNVVTFNNNDGECIAIDHHENSRCVGEKPDYRSIEYLDFLAVNDDRIAKGLDAIHSYYKNSYTRKIGHKIVQFCNKAWIKNIVSFFERIVRKNHKN